MHGLGEMWLLRTEMEVAEGGREGWAYSSIGAWRVRMCWLKMSKPDQRVGGCCEEGSECKDLGEWGQCLLAASAEMGCTRPESHVDAERRGVGVLHEGGGSGGLKGVHKAAHEVYTAAREFNR